MACSTSEFEDVTASKATSSRAPTFSIQEFNDLVSSALDKDMSFSPTLSSSASHSLSPESKPLHVLPYYKRPRGFLQKLKNRVSVFKRRARVRDTVATAPHSPSSSAQGLALSSRVLTRPPRSPLLSAPLVRFQSRSASHRSFAPSDSSFASTSTSEIKRTILTQFKLSAFRSHSKNSSSVSRRTISNPSPVPSSSLGCRSDFKTVRDLDAYDLGLDLEHPRQAPRPPTVSHSESMEGRNSFYFGREFESPEFDGILLEQPDVQMDTSLFSTENKPNTPPRPPNLIISRPISSHSQSDPFSASSSPTAFDDDVNYISTPTPGTPKYPYIHHPYSYSPLLGAPFPTGLTSGSASTSASQSILPSPLSTMFFPLPPCSPPSLPEKRGGGAIGNIALAVSSTLSFGNGMREKGKGKKIPAPIKVEDPFNSFQKPSSKFGAFLSRLSPTNITSGPSSSSSSFVQHSTAALAPLPTSSSASCGSLIFTSDEEGEDMGSSPAAYSPLTPLDFTFGFGDAGIADDSPVRSGVRVTLDTAAHEVSIFEDDEDEEPNNSVPDREEEGQDEQVGVDPFNAVHKPSIDSVIARFSAPSDSNSKPELEREVEVVSVISSDSGVYCKPLPVPRVRRRPPPVPPPFHPLPNPPTQRPPPSSFPPSSYSNDWTLALPFLTNSPQSGFISAEKYQRMELQRMREIRNDWTLGLDLTLSAGMLMGDERGDGQGRGGRTHSRLPPRLQEDRRLERKRSGSPFPLLERSRERPLSHAIAVSNADDGTSVGIHGKDGAMERAFQALLTDAGEGRLSQFGLPLFLPNENPPVTPT